jgi:hypothetical protein
VAKEKVETTDKKKSKPRTKKLDLSQYIRVDILAGKAPDLSLIFIDKDCWKVLPKQANSKMVKLWRLKQAGGDEVIEVPTTQSVKIQMLYLENAE